ncbi:MAG: hypothetical protein PHY82_01495 [Lentisphaeria bacterium]|nr:hypothetical protein [Lentisphaeria bacterium]
MKKFLTMTALLISGLLLAEEAPAKEKVADVAKPVAPPQMQRAGRRGGNPQMQENMIKRMRENAAALLKKYDADGDGKLNDAEKAALEKDMKLVEELFPLSITYKRMKVIDKDGDLVISDEEAANIDMEAIRENMQRNRGGMRPERPNRPERPAPRKQQPKPEEKD